MKYPLSPQLSASCIGWFDISDRDKITLANRRELSALGSRHDDGTTTLDTANSTNPLYDRGLFECDGSSDGLKGTSAGLATQATSNGNYTVFVVARPHTNHLGTLWGWGNSADNDSLVVCRVAAGGKIQITKRDDSGANVPSITSTGASYTPNGS